MSAAAPASPMTARRLLEWGDLDERRRRAARGTLAALPRPVVSLLGAAVLFALVARSLGGLGEGLRQEATGASGSALLIAAIAILHVMVLFGAPFRMYWRRDSALLGRLAIDGGALYAVALVRSLRGALLVALPCAVASTAFGIWASWEIALRHLALVGVAALWAAFVGPGVALAAGAIVASDRAQALIASMGGEMQAPKTSWLGILPGFAATGLVLVLIACTGWVTGAESTAVGPAPALLIPCAVAPLVALLWSRSAAPRVMLAAQREVSALDQERLAHVDLTTPSALERVWSRLVVGRADARLVFEKDAKLARRRYPIPFFVGAVAVLALWGLALGAPDSMLVWAGTVAASVGLYGVIMARRHVVPPIEHPRLLRSLAVSRAGAARAKRQRVILWNAAYVVLGSAPVIARAGDVVSAALVLGGVAALSLGAGVYAARI